MLDRILIANGDEIACGIIRTSNRLNSQSIAVYSEIDRHATHLNMATEAFCISKATAAERSRSLNYSIGTTTSCLKRS